MTQSTPKVAQLLKKPYEKASCQKINAYNSSYPSHLKHPNLDSQRAKLSLGIEREGVEKYIELEEHFGIHKKTSSHLQLTVSNCGIYACLHALRPQLVNWQCWNLSLLLFLTFVMSYFQLPMNLYQRIQYVLTRFWWDSTDSKKNICLVLWNKLTKLKIFEDWVLET